MRIFLVLIAVSLLSSCVLATENGAPKEKTTITANATKDENIIKSILKPLKSRGVEIKGIREVKNFPLNDFNTFEVSLIDKGRNAIVRKYIWISKDDRYIALDLFNIKAGKNRLIISPVKPKNSITPFKQDLSWVKNMDELLQKENIPHVIGNGKNKVYIVWDVYCPFCYSHFKEVTGKKVKELDLQIHLLPLPVHGKESLKGFVYFTQIVRKYGMKIAMKEMFSKGNGEFMNYYKEFSSEVKENYSKIPKKEREKLEKFYKDFEKKLLSHNIHATPTIIYIPPAEKNKGYVFVGFRPLKDVIKLK